MDIEVVSAAKLRQPFFSSFRADHRPVILNPAAPGSESGISVVESVVQEITADLREGRILPCATLRGERCSRCNPNDNQG